MNTLIRSTALVAWLNGLDDAKGKARVLSRLDSASLGNFGDCKAVGEGVSEMRINVGPGYRVYFIRCEEQTYSLLAGGDKSSQDRDIRRAKEMASTVKKETKDAKAKKSKPKD
jgi:putative addiction module killer protein